jgi:hypothetical protein
MSAPGRLLAVSLGLTVLVVLVGCGDSQSGVPDSKIRSALQMKSIQGHLAIEGNPFCATSRLLRDATEVKDAGSSGRVIASRDHTIGVQVIKPFAPSCRNFAERKLDKVARGGGKKKHQQSNAGKEKNEKKGGGGGG